MGGGGGGGGGEQETNFGTDDGVGGKGKCKKYLTSVFFLHDIYKQKQQMPLNVGAKSLYFTLPFSQLH